MNSYLTTTNRNIAWLRNAYEQGKLDVQPPFQRNPVWTEKQKSYLIDTILHGFPIPEIYMKEKVDEKGEDKYIIVDGQQRIRACLEYIKNEYPINKTDSPEWGDLFFEDLTSEDKKKIYNYNFVVRVLPDVEEEDLRKMFQRLNRNVVALNKQELRHATYWGEFITLMEKLSNEEFWLDTGVFTPNDIKRMNDVEYISELSICYLHGVQNKKDTLDKYYELYEQNFDSANEIESVIKTTIPEILKIIPNIKETRFRKKSDFYSLFYVLARHYKNLPFPSDVRNNLGNMLTKFSEDVEKCMRDDNKDKYGKDVVKFSDLVQRSTSDAERRIERDIILKNIIEPFIKGV